MGKRRLKGPGWIAPENKELTKKEYLQKLMNARESYLRKLLSSSNKEDVEYICRLEKARFEILLAWDQITEEQFQTPQKDVPACIDCPNATDCEENKICVNWSLADFAGHLLTHEEKEIGPDTLEPLKHMAEHEETHLRQIQEITKKYKLKE